MKDCEEKASSFLVKLLNMLRSKQNAKTIAWDANEKGIKILNQQNLQDVLLPKYFRHNRFASFVRQLNMYDFHKVYLENNNSIFYHDVFNPRDKQSIYKIKRKSPPSNEQMYQGEKQNEKYQKQIFEEPNTKNQNTKIISDVKEEPKKRCSFKLLFKNSIGSLNQRKNQEKVTAQLIFEEIMTQITPNGLNKQTIKQKIQELRKSAKFRRFLKKSSFIRQLYIKLGIQMDQENDKLSQLSIEEELMFDTKKSLTLHSLKMFESGPINMRDTLAMFLS